MCQSQGQKGLRAQGSFLHSPGEAAGEGRHTGSLCGMGLAHSQVSTYGRSTGGGGDWLEERQPSAPKALSSALALGQHYGLCSFLIYKMGAYIQ